VVILPYLRSSRVGVGISAIVAHGRPGATDAERPARRPAFQSCPPTGCPT